MTISLELLWVIIFVALAFDFLNGLHDAANSIATIVSTRVLRPQYAVAWAAFFNFIAFLFFGLSVAQTVGTGIISPDIVDPRVILGALAGAIACRSVASACANAFTPPALLAARKKSPAWKVAEVLEVRSPRWLTCDPQGATSRWLLTCLTAWRGVSPGRCRRYSAANAPGSTHCSRLARRRAISTTDAADGCAIEAAATVQRGTADRRSR